MKERMRNIREVLGLTQKEFAARLEIPYTTISKYEHGNIKPSSDILSKIGRSYNVNLHWLLTGEGEMLLQDTNRDTVQTCSHCGQPYNLNMIVTAQERLVDTLKLQNQFLQQQLQEAQVKAEFGEEESPAFVDNGEMNISSLLKGPMTGATLKKVRDHYRLTNREIAKQTGVPMDVIKHSIATGMKNPSEADQEQLRQYFNALESKQMSMAEE